MKTFRNKKQRDNYQDNTKQHNHMNRRFYFKNILWGMCPIIISILHLMYDTPTEASIKVDLFLIFSGLTLPCSIYLTKTITLKCTSISFWKKPFFWSNGIHHFHLVYIMICLVLAIPSAIIVLFFHFYQNITRNRK